GSIDEVAIYTKALTDSQVLAHYCNQFGATQRPLVGVQPAPFTKQWIGWPVSLSAVAAGSCTLNYQWFKGNTPPSDTATITGSLSNHLDISAVDFTDAGNYTLHVNNSLGSATSAVAVVTVVSTPTNALSMAGLVLHLTFDNTLADATGRGNDGTGKHT